MSLAHISLMETLVVLLVLNVELCYTRAQQQWDYVTSVVSARQCSSTFHPDYVNSLNHQVSVSVVVVRHPLCYCHGWHVVPTWAHLVTACAPTLHCESSLLIPAFLEHHEFHGRESQRMWWRIKLWEDHEGFPQESARSIKCRYDEINKSGVQCLLRHPIG